MKWFKWRENKPENSVDDIGIQDEVSTRAVQLEENLRKYLERFGLVIEEIGEIGKQIAEFEPRTSYEQNAPTANNFGEWAKEWANQWEERRYLAFCAYRLIDELTTLRGLIRVISASLEPHYEKLSNRKGIEWLNEIRTFTAKIEQDYVKWKASSPFSDCSVEQMETQLKNQSWD